jgi:hypothetical protein
MAKLTFVLLALVVASAATATQVLPTSFVGATWNNNNGIACTNSTTCNFGACQVQKCQCTKPYISLKEGSTEFACLYKANLKLTTFLFSFFLGGLGIDWFTLARGNGCYICAGVGKILTCGALGIWSCVDWIRVLTNSFPDGNGAPLFNDM